jgi:hypothetical protein
MRHHHLYQGDKLHYILRMNFSNASNNKVQYEALLHGKRMAKACGATRLMIYGDSNKFEEYFYGYVLLHIDRMSNEEVDNLANIGSTCAPIPLEYSWKKSTSVLSRSRRLHPIQQ